MGGINIKTSMHVRFQPIGPIRKKLHYIEHHKNTKDRLVLGHPVPQRKQEQKKKLAGNESVNILLFL